MFCVFPTEASESSHDSKLLVSAHETLVGLQHRLNIYITVGDDKCSSRFVQCLRMLCNNILILNDNSCSFKTDPRSNLTYDPAPGANKERLFSSLV